MFQRKIHTITRNSSADPFATDSWDNFILLFTTSKRDLSPKCSPNPNRQEKQTQIPHKHHTPSAKLLLLLHTMTSKCRSSTNWGSKNRSISLSLAGRRPASCGPLCVNNSYYYSTRTCRFRMGTEKNERKNSQSLHLTFHRNCRGDMKRFCAQLSHPVICKRFLGLTWRSLFAK